jgi:hypothetical protein
MAAENDARRVANKQETSAKIMLSTGHHKLESKPEFAAHQKIG